MRATPQLLAVALAIADLTSAQNVTAEVANLEHYWSYDRSAPVYPTRESEWRTNMSETSKADHFE